MKRTAVICAILALVLSFPAFAESVAMPQLVIPTAASNGFGGTHVAFTDNVFSLFVNPAAMMRAEQRSFFTLAPTFFNPERTVSLGSALTGLSTGDTSAFGDAADTLSKQKGRIALGLELREFPFSIAWVADGFGFGLWNRTFVNASIIGTTVRAEILEDFMLPIGFAFKILESSSHSLDAGITLKPFARLWAKEQEKIIALMDNDSDLIDRISIPVIAGGSFDLGLMYRWDIGLRAGFTFNDICSKGVVVSNLNDQVKDDNSYYFPFTMNLGLAYDIKLAFLGLTFAFDWRDISNAFNQDDYMRRNAMLDLGLGVQLSIFDKIKIRLGMNEMLPAVGLGFDLGACKIDLAYYGKEFGNEPGQLSTAMVDLSISIRPGAAKRNWPWAGNSIF